MDAIQPSVLGVYAADGVAPVLNQIRVRTEFTVWGLWLLAACGVTAGSLVGFRVARRVCGRRSQNEFAAWRAEHLAELRQLTAGSAHDARNSLMTMKILVQAAAETGESASLHAPDLRVLEEEMTRLERSIKSLLDLVQPVGAAGKTRSQTGTG